MSSKKSKPSSRLRTRGAHGAPSQDSAHVGAEPRSKLYASDSNLPILNSGRLKGHPNNFPEWKRAFDIQLPQEYGTRGTFISNDGVVEEDKPKHPRYVGISPETIESAPEDYFEDESPDNIVYLTQIAAEKAFSDLASQYARRRRENRDTDIAMHSRLWSNISEDSRELIAQHPDFERESLEKKTHIGYSS